MYFKTFSNSCNINIGATGAQTRFFVTVNSSAM